MAVKQKARGKAERRTAPARGVKARSAAKQQAIRRDAAAASRARSRRTAKLRFLKKDRVFHLVDPTAFVLTIDRKGIEHRGPAKDARTICCDKPIAKVFGIAISRASFREPVAWCAGVPA